MMSSGIGSGWLQEDKTRKSSDVQLIVSGCSDKKKFQHEYQVFIKKSVAVVSFRTKQKSKIVFSSCVTRFEIFCSAKKFFVRIQKNLSPCLIALNCWFYLLALCCSVLLFFVGLDVWIAIPVSQNWLPSHSTSVRLLRLSVSGVCSNSYVHEYVITTNLPSESLANTFEMLGNMQKL